MLLLVITTISFSVLTMVNPATAQLARETPKELEGIGIIEHPNAQLPTDARFKTEDGEDIALGDLIDGTKPVLLTLIYFECPMLCSLVVNGAVDAMKRMKYVPGKEFTMITISFNPLETPTLAKLKKQAYIKDYGRPEAASGWMFLTGTEENIKRVTEAVGFGYKWNEKMQEYAHSAAIFVVTPDGRLSRYLYGVLYDPNTLRLSLLEASEGKIGTPLDKIIMYCFHYDEREGKYTPRAVGIMRAGGFITLLILAGIFCGVFFKRRLDSVTRHVTETNSNETA